MFFTGGWKEWTFSSPPHSSHYVLPHLQPHLLFKENSTDLVSVTCIHMWQQAPVTDCQFSNLSMWSRRQTKKHVFQRCPLYQRTYAQAGSANPLMKRQSRELLCFQYMPSAFSLHGHITLLGTSTPTAERSKSFYACTLLFLQSQSNLHAAFICAARSTGLKFP